MTILENMDVREEIQKSSGIFRNMIPYIWDWSELESIQIEEILSNFAADNLKSNIPIEPCHSFEDLIHEGMRPKEIQLVNSRPQAVLAFEYKDLCGGEDLASIVWKRAGYAVSRDKCDYCLNLFESPASLLHGQLSLMAEELPGTISPHLTAQLCFPGARLLCDANHTL